MPLFGRVADKGDPHGVPIGLGEGDGLGGFGGHWFSGGELQVSYTIQSTCQGVD